MQIGTHAIATPVILAPMAGITDRPFRQLCRRLGAGLAVSEMTSSNPRLWDTEKSRLRRDHEGEDAPIAVQIAGYDPQLMADAARLNADLGAQIIDINMGCPAKKVCKVDSGSALLRDEGLVSRICAAVVRAAGVPVTLKIRTGYSRDRKNGPAIARLAEDAGIAALSVHGRTREDHFEGAAEHDTTAAIKQAVKIPVIANGDIRTATQARDVLQRTGADAVMIGRAALGRPWIFHEIRQLLASGRVPPPPDPADVHRMLRGHVLELHRFYGEGRGLRVARKHIQWYCQDHPSRRPLWLAINKVECARSQLAILDDWLGGGALAAAA